MRVAGTTRSAVSRDARATRSRPRLPCDGGRGLSDGRVTVAGTSRPIPQRALLPPRLPLWCPRRGSEVPGRQPHAHRVTDTGRAEVTPRGTRTPAGQLEPQTRPRRRTRKPRRRTHSIPLPLRLFPTKAPGSTLPSVAGRRGAGGGRGRRGRPAVGPAEGRVPALPPPPSAPHGGWSELRCWAVSSSNSFNSQ